MQEIKRQQTPGFRILLVEDNNELRNAVRDILTDTISDISIHEAESAETAEEILNNQQPDIVITDIQLPAQNGLKLTRKIKTRFPSIPVIIHTHYNIPEYREAAEALGTEGFFIKGKSRLADMVCLVNLLLKKD